MEEDVIVKQQYCAAVRKQVQLIETRIYPESDFLSMDEYRVKKTECALAWNAAWTTTCTACGQVAAAPIRFQMPRETFTVEVVTDSSAAIEVRLSCGV